MEKILRLTSVIEATGDSRSKIYDNISHGTFPSPVKIGVRASGWIAREIDAVNRARIAGKAEPEIRDLVSRLKAARAHALDEVSEGAAHQSSTAAA
jgi:prophage regulatory protein